MTSVALYAFIDCSKRRFKSNCLKLNEMNAICLSLCLPCTLRLESILYRLKISHRVSFSFSVFFFFWFYFDCSNFSVSIIVAAAKEVVVVIGVVAILGFADVVALDNDADGDFRILLALNGGIGSI